MVSTAPEYLWLVEESAYGVPMAAPVVGASQFLVPLVDSNSFAMSEEPQFQEIKYGGGLDVVADVVADHRVCKGSLSTLGYPALTAFLLKAAVTKIDAAVAPATANTVPWVTTEPAGDLASFTVYHMIRRRDGSLIVHGYPGCKVMSLEGSVSRQDPKLKLKLELMAQKELPNAADGSAAPTPPAPPAETDYPRGPYLFSHTGGNVLLAATALTQYENLTFRVNNKVDARHWESKWIQTMGLKGREASADVDLLLKATPALRSDFLALTSRSLAVKFNNGVNTATIDYHGNNHLNKIPYDLPLGKEFTQKATWRNKWDAVAAADVTVSST